MRTPDDEQDEQPLPRVSFLLCDENNAMTAEDWERLRAAVDTPSDKLFRASVAFDIYRSLRPQAPHLVDWEHPAPE
jgi:hypothetical protein